jgi:hypothetical protein
MDFYKHLNVLSLEEVLWYELQMILHWIFKVVDKQNYANGFCLCASGVQQKLYTAMQDTYTSLRLCLFLL